MPFKRIHQVNLDLAKGMSARHVVPNGKSYITTEFTGKLLSDGDKRYAIYDLEHPLFNVINGGTIKNINFENCRHRSFW